MTIIVQRNEPFVAVEDYLGAAVTDPYGFGDPTRICHRDCFYEAIMAAQSAGINTVRFTGNYLFERSFRTDGGSTGDYAGLVNCNNITLDGNNQGTLRRGTCPNGPRTWFPVTEVDINDAVAGKYYFITSIGNTSQADWNTFFGTTGVTYVANGTPTGVATNENYAAVDGSTLADSTGTVEECIPLEYNNSIRQYSRMMSVEGSLTNFAMKNCTLDAWGWWQFGCMFHTSNATAINNLLFENVTTIDSTDTPFGKYVTGDMNFTDSLDPGYVEISAPTATVSGDFWHYLLANEGYTFDGVRLIGCTHNASEHQWCASGEAGGSVCRNYTYAYNDISGSISVCFGLTSEPTNITTTSFPTYENVLVTGNVMRNIWGFVTSWGLDGTGTGQTRRVKLNNIRIVDNTFRYDDDTAFLDGRTPNAQDRPMVRIRLGEGQQAGDVTNFIIERNKIEFGVGWNQTTYARTNGISLVHDAIDSNTAAPEIITRRNTWDNEVLLTNPANLQFYPSPGVSNYWPDYRVGHLLLDERNIVSGTAPFDTGLDADIDFGNNDDCTFLFHIQIRETSPNNERMRIYDKSNGLGNYLIFGINTSGQFQMSTAGSSGPHTFSTSNALTPKQWYTIVARFFGNEYKVWFNGVAQNNWTILNNRRGLSPGENAHIGSRRDGASEYFEGGICFVRVWNEAIREEIIPTITESTLAEPIDEDATGLVAAYDWRDGQSLTSNPLGGSLTQTNGTFTLTNTTYSFPRRQPILTVG